MGDIILNGALADMVHQQTELGGYPSPEALLHEAVECLVQQKIDKGIQRGLDDIQAGRFKTLNLDTIDDIAQSIVEKSLQ
jgi:predicted transcriptional regulator